MKKLILSIAGIFLIAIFTASAKTLPTVAAKLPVELKDEISKNIDYPSFAQQNKIEGVVWMKVTVLPDAQIKLLEVSATNPELGAYVQKELDSVYVNTQKAEPGKVYYVKVRFDLL